MLLFGFALSWLGVAAGALVRTPEALQGIIFAVVFPLTFVSSAFVPTETMPDWLEWFANRQPMTLVTNAVRRPHARRRRWTGVRSRRCSGRSGSWLVVVPARPLALQPPHDAVGPRVSRRPGSRPSRPDPVTFQRHRAREVVFRGFGALGGSVRT